MMSLINIQYYKTPLGKLIIGSFNEQLCLCDWIYRKNRELIDTRIKNYLQADFVFNKSKIIDDTINQIDEYLRKERKIFDISLLLCGSDFQKSVWNELLTIPYGKTNSYLDLSKKMKNEKAIRAVANANGANAISIIIPCHRIIGSKGELTGYAGGLTVKKKLLELEAPSLQTSLF